MKMTPELKAEFDKMDFEQLLRLWRFAPAGDERFQGESGDYLAARLSELRRKEPDAGVSVSKRVGW